MKALPNAQIVEELQTGMDFSYVNAYVLILKSWKATILNMKEMSNAARIYYRLNPVLSSMYDRLRRHRRLYLLGLRLVGGEMKNVRSNERFVHIDLEDDVPCYDLRIVLKELFDHLNLQLLKDRKNMYRVMDFDEAREE